IGFDTDFDRLFTLQGPGGRISHARPWRVPCHRQTAPPEPYPLRPLHRSPRSPSSRRRLPASRTRPAPAPPPPPHPSPRGPASRPRLPASPPRPVPAPPPAPPPTFLEQVKALHQQHPNCQD